MQLKFGFDIEEQSRTTPTTMSKPAPEISRVAEVFLYEGEDQGKQPRQDGNHTQE